MKLTLSLTHRCNLACGYCYGGAPSARDMSPETLARSLAFAWSLGQANDPLQIVFFGGEPLLRQDLIARAVALAEERQRHDPRAVSYSLTTNGTLLEPAALSLLRQHDISTCISLDGPAAIHDPQRPFRHGGGSFAVVMEKLHQARQELPFLQVNTVFGPGNLEQLEELGDFLFSLPVDVVHLNPDIRATWDRAAVTALPERFAALADSLIRAFRQGREVSFNLIDSKIILFLKKGYEPRDRCGMGCTEWAIAPSGNVYPCERFIGEDGGDAFVLGNVHGEVSRASCPGALFPPLPREAVNPCPDCDYRDYCMHWCGCTNFFLSGHPGLTTPLLCAMEQSTLLAARRVVNTLQGEDNQLFMRHCARFLEHGAPISTP